MTDNARLRCTTLFKLRAFMLVFLFALISTSFSVSAVTQEATQDAEVLASPLSYEALADALSNDKVRDKLVNELRSLAANEDDTEGELSSTSMVLAQDLTETQESNQFIIRLQAFAQGLRTDVIKSWQVVRGLVSGEGPRVEKLRAWQSALFNLLMTVITVIVAYVLFRRVASPIFKRFDIWAQRLPTKTQIDSVKNKQIKRRAERKKLAEETKARQEKRETEIQNEAVSNEFGHLKNDDTPNEDVPEVKPADNPHAVSHFALRYTKLRKLAAVVAALAVDLITIFAAALVGYVMVLALPALHTSQHANLLSMQFLTAFFAVEVVKSISRAVFATRYDKLRLVPINHESATYWNRWVATVITAGGYGLLVLVPVLQTVLSTALANVVGAVLILVVYVYAVRVLWHKRHSVTDTLLKQAEHADNAFIGTVLRITAKLWVWVALLYFTVLFVVTQADQQNALGFMANASAKTLLALLVGGVLSLILGTLVTHRLHLSAHWNQTFPLLEERLNSYIPATFQVIRLFVFAGVLLSIFDAWQVLDLKEWLSSPHGQAILNTTIRVAVVLIIAALGWTVLASMIEHRLASSGTRIPTEREKTLLMLFRNALAIIIVTMTTLIVLSQVGIDIGPLIAGAGVVGLAVGFGAQKLVQDVITGVFIQLENGMNQNDVVEVAGLFGVVEKLTIRSVVIRTLDGGYHLVPFSSIDCVANHTRDYGYHHGEYMISLRESVDDAIEHLKAAFIDLKKDPEVADAILEDITIPGVSALGKEGASIRVLIKTTPGMQWAVQRSFNRLVKQHFDAAGIEIPYPQTVLHFGRNKNGATAPANIHMVDAVAQASRGTSA